MSSLHSPNTQNPTTLVLNAGSSSLKVSLFAYREPDSALVHGVVQSIGAEVSQLSLYGAGDSALQRDLSCPDHHAALSGILRSIDDFLGPEWRDAVGAVGHRIVHGGSRFTEPTRITPDVENALAALRELAPLHNSSALTVVHDAITALPHTPHVASFDTMFHARLPPETVRYALPLELSDRLQIRRYGFHGLSCTWSMSRLPALGAGEAKRVIICHLGAGASVTAVLDGDSFDTSMGFTPLEGLIMATRSGSIDPSIVLYLQRHAGLGVDDVEQLLERQSGLLGLSGISGDIRILEQQARGGDSHAKEALAAFAYRVRATIGAFWAALGGVDILVFTGGIGENAPDTRERILRPLGSIGVQMNWDANTEVQGGREGSISIESSRPRVLVIPAREELVIARQVRDLLTSARI